MRANVLISTLTATAFSLVPSAFAQLSASEKADQVKDAFKFAWDGYYEYAFPNDELHPVSNTFGNSRNGWGASTADALSTAAIMELPDVVDQILDHLANVDFTNTNSSVSVFETTIRYLAGMISGYDLLNDEALSHLASKPEQVEALLDQSVVLADVMKFAFDSTSGIPYNNIDIVNKTTDGSSSTGLAVAGTLVLEWTRLSHLTGDPEYASLSQLAQSYLIDPKPDWAEPYDGLVGSSINVTTGEFTDASVSWSGGADSFYEYLLKMYVYDNKEFGAYGDRWEAAAKSSIEELFSETGDDKRVFMAELSDGNLVYQSQHLTCFDGGSFILGGQIFKNKDYLDAGLKLVDGCRATYASTATGIGPETFSWAKDEVPDEEADFYEREGFFITGSNYNMRPEVIESYYYAFRATGDEKYRDWAWEAFVAINATTRTASGFSAIDDVNSPDGGKKLDNQESFLFAEVMKYLYLIFAPDDDWQVDANGNNKYVYNTEAHPVKVAKTA